MSIDDPFTKASSLLQYERVPNDGRELPIRVVPNDDRNLPIRVESDDDRWVESDEETGRRGKYEMQTPYGALRPSFGKSGGCDDALPAWEPAREPARSRTPLRHKPRVSEDVNDVLSLDEECPGDLPIEDRTWYDLPIRPFQLLSSLSLTCFRGL